MRLCGVKLLGPFPQCQYFDDCVFVRGFERVCHLFYYFMLVRSLHGQNTVRKYLSTKLKNYVIKCSLWCENHDTNMCVACPSRLANISFVVCDVESGGKSSA